MEPAGETKWCVYVLMHACFTGDWHLHLNLTFFICEFGTLNFLIVGGQVLNQG
jgi:hypothetical protein